MSDGKAMRTFSAVKDAGPTEQTLLLELTARQRQAIFDAARLSPQIIARLDSLPDGDKWAIPFSRRELDQLSDELNEAALRATELDRRRLAAVLDQLDETIDATCRGPDQPLAAGRLELGAGLLFQFKVTLLDLHPAVWRRFQIEGGTLGDLHAAIQAALGWRDERPHRFVIGGIAYGRPADDRFGFGGGDDRADEILVRLSDLTPPSGRRARWIYEYDFRAGWRHEVLFEGYPAREREREYPVCLAGEMACPPESIAGPRGYGDFLESLGAADQSPGGHAADRNGGFDPEAFDFQAATRRMREAS